MYNTSNRSESVLPLNFSTRTVCSCRAVATLSLSSVTALSSACTYMYMYICNNVEYSVQETTHTTGTITKQKHHEGFMVTMQYTQNPSESDISRTVSNTKKEMEHATTYQ